MDRNCFHIIIGIMADIIFLTCFVMVVSQLRVCRARCSAYISPGGEGLGTAEGSSGGGDLKGYGETSFRSQS